MSNSSRLAAPDRRIRDAYRHLVEEIDRVMTDLIGGRLAGRIVCRPGCSACCMEFSVLPLEAALLVEGLDGRPAGEACREGRCVFLQADLCSIYPLRPIICRTQGMALAYVDAIEERIEVSACPLNFGDDEIFDQEDLLFMDGFNERLAALNLRYCSDNGLAAAVRIALADLTPLAEPPA